MGWKNRACLTIDPANANGVITALYPNNDAIYIHNGWSNSRASTSGGVVTYSKSCAHSAWGYNTHEYTISMDTALRNTISQKIESGGLINITNYVLGLDEFQGYDMNGSRELQVYGLINRTRSYTGTFEASQFGYWEGNWPTNYPVDVTYNYNIPGVGNVSDTVTLITEGWWTEAGKHNWISYGSGVFARYTIDQLKKPPSTWGWDSTHYAQWPFDIGGIAYLDAGYTSMSYFTVNGIYSWGTGSRNCYANNACDVLLNANSAMFHGITATFMNSYIGSGTETTYLGAVPTVMSNVIMAITKVDMVNNTIKIKFAMAHDPDHTVCMFIPNKHYSITALRIKYSYPVTAVTKPTDNWGIKFVSDNHFNPTEANGTGASTLIWDSANNAVVLTPGKFVNNDNGYSKIVSRHSGSLSCSCSNVNGTVRINIGGYSVTIPSNISTIYIRILALNNGSIGYWQINPPGTGFSHAFSINYPETADAPLISYENELYTAITQALGNNGVPYLFEISNITDEYSITISGLVKCDSYLRDNKKYYAVSVYDVTGNFSQLLVKNGMYVTMPVTVTVDLEMVNNSILVKAGMATIGYTSTSIGDVPSDVDGVAVLLPAVAVIQKNGVKVGYATSTVNQNSFAFSFTANKNEVEQTDDFVSHYLQ